MTADNKIARQLAKKIADDRAHRIATTAAEDLIRSEVESTGVADQYLIPQYMADERMRDCIAHLVWIGKAASLETDNGYIAVVLIERD